MERIGVATKKSGWRISASSAFACASFACNGGQAATRTQVDKAGARLGAGFRCDRVSAATCTLLPTTAIAKTLFFVIG